jgi:hypothetical protein
MLSCHAHTPFTGFLVHVWERAATNEGARTAGIGPDDCDLGGVPDRGRAIPGPDRGLAEITQFTLVEVRHVLTPKYFRKCRKLGAVRVFSAPLQVLQ